MVNSVEQRVWSNDIGQDNHTAQVERPGDYLVGMSKRSEEVQMAIITPQTQRGNGALCIRPDIFMCA